MTNQLAHTSVAPASTAVLRAPVLLRANAAFLMAGFILLHLAVWTVLPIAFTHALPRDLVEGVVWGQGWQLGYDQPPFQAWFLGSVDWLSGYQRWAVYLLCQLLVAICFGAVWRLARLIVSPLGALVSVLLLDGIMFFNFMTPNLYPDLIELPFWALATWTFYRALRFGRLADWLLLGLWLAAAAYGKYVSAVLAMVMIGFMLVEPQARRSWRTAGPYLCAGLSLLLLVPHLWWGFDNGFPTFAHIRHVSRPAGGISDRLLSLAGFVGGELASIAAIGLLVLALGGRRPGEKPISLAGDPATFDRRFVASLALGPILLMLGAAVLSGTEFRVHWGYAMWCFLGLFAVVFLVPAVSGAALRHFAWCWAGVFVFAAAAFAGINSIASYPYQSNTPRLIRELLPKDVLRRFHEEADYPGPELADTITRSWHEQVGRPLAYVAGKKWVAGLISFYSADHPLVLRDGVPAGSPWIDMARLAQQGAVVVWDPSRKGDEDAGDLEHEFPTMKMQPPIVIPWHTGADVPPLRILWGIVYPTAR